MVGEHRGSKPPWRVVFEDSEDGVGGRGAPGGAPGGEDDDGESTQRALPVEASASTSAG